MLSKKYGMILSMIIVVLVVLGLALGSFTNAAVWRIHEQTKQRKNKKLSILHGRSMCPNCKHTLEAKDLIPVLSWLGLRGKCRYCGKPISWQYPLVELLMAVLFVSSYLLWPYGLALVGNKLIFGFWLLILVFFMILLIYDLKWMLLPNRVVYPLIMLAGIEVITISVLSRSPTPAIAGFWGVLCLFGLFYVLFQISKGKWIGGGDVKLAIALGLIVGGPIPAFLVLFIASLLGVIVSIPLLVQGKRGYSSRVPFGPFLIVATILVYIFGGMFVKWYLLHVIGG